MKKEQENKRAGGTIVTSVSVSKEFANLIEQYDISPTECFRRGVAVSLFDFGVEMYQSKINKKRFEYVKIFLKKIEQDEKLREEFENIILFEKVKKNMQAIKKIIKEIEKDEE